MSCRRALVLILFLGLLLRLFDVLWLGLVVEDAYITFRHAANLVDGHGFVFNPGDRVLGSTAPLWGFLVALAMAVLGSDGGILGALGLGIVADLLTVAFIHRILRETSLGEGAALLGAGVMALLWPFAVGATCGMEQPVFGLLLVAAVRAAQVDRRGLAAGLAAASMLLRPEGVALLGLIVLAEVIERRRPPWHSVAVAAVVLAPWIAVATSYYGSPFPTSATTKSHLTSLEFIASRLDPGLLFDRAARFALVLAPAQGWSAGAVLWGVFWGIAFLMGSARLWREKRGLWVFPAFYFAYALGHTLGTRFFGYWYVFPAALCFSVTAAAGAWILAELAGRWLRSPAAGRWGVGLAVASVVLTGTVRFVAGVLEHYPRRLDELPATGRVVSYGANLEVARWIASHSAPDATLFLEPAGYIPFHSGRRTLEVAGIATPEVRRSMQSRGLVATLRRFEPDLIVLRGHEVRQNHSYGGSSLFVDGSAERWFHERYELAHVVEPFAYVDPVHIVDRLPFATVRSPGFTVHRLRALPATDSALISTYRADRLHAEPTGSGTATTTPTERYAPRTYEAVMRLRNVGATGPGRVRVRVEDVERQLSLVSVEVDTDRAGAVVPVSFTLDQACPIRLEAHTPPGVELDAIEVRVPLAPLASDPGAETP